MVVANDGFDVRENIVKNVELGKMRINGIRKISNEKVILKVQNREDASTMEGNIKESIGPNLKEIQILGRKKPVIIFKDIYEDFLDDQLKEDLLLKNPSLGEYMREFNVKRTIRVKRTIGDTVYEAKHILVEVNTECRRFLITEGKVFLGFQRIRVEDANPLVQCYHCLGFNHTALKCKKKDKPPICMNCAKAHKTKDCKSNDKYPQCGNCLRMSESETQPSSVIDMRHRANNFNCKIYKRKLFLAKQKIDY
jgi:hypothetical protein